MFTGIIEAVGQVLTIEPRGGDVRLHIGTVGKDVGHLPMDGIQLGDSIATNGVCLTVIEKSAQGYWTDVSVETLDLTTIRYWEVGTPVNVEYALTPASRLGGHIVSGHVDGVGEVLSRHPDARSERFMMRAPSEIAKYIAHKGSITVDGTSLTVNSVDGCDFDVNILPYTITHTVIGGYESGTKINLEVDVIARYLERLLLGDQAAAKQQTLIASKE
ncbi:riboflavin synthase subunit alpha [Candidatus Endobugula sertula]|uniref:Riboflavin synthase n=1 Tax=Candidatus Endobugula sertula TaxID=62101 RepID=A0A1D2QRR5_9GAMM|nr:riboflavin synthase subunit alpha [Candidatus Endobugula sertula]